MNKIHQQLSELRVVPVIKINHATNAVGLAKTLLANNLPLAEIIFRTSAAADSIRAMKQAFPAMSVGAGTILTIDQAKAAIEAGCDFIVTPALNPEIVDFCQKKGMTIIPGVNNPQMIDQALTLGLKVVKFFPAEASGGIDMIKSLAGVFPIQFMPTGGIHSGNLTDYLAQPSVIACGGSWMVPSELIDYQNWDAIGLLIRKALEIAHKLQHT